MTSSTVFIQAMRIVLVGVMGVLVVTSWLLLGAIMEKHPVRYKFYRFITSVVSLFILGVMVYLFFGPGRELVKDILG